MKELNDFIDKLKLRARHPFPASGYFYFDGDSVYLRYGYSFTYGCVAITIANVTVHKKNRRVGRFSNYLSVVEGCAKSEGAVVVVESVCNPFLPEFLLKNGFLLIAMCKVTL